MFYSERLQSPINAYNVKRMYGVNPDNDPARAALQSASMPVIESKCLRVIQLLAYLTKEGQAYRGHPS